MHCLFCREPTDRSRSKEHVIPESLGNTDHVLPPGWVCDVCNHYLGSHVEAPFLASLHLSTSRFGMGVPSKRGRIPRVRAIGLGTSVEIERLSVGPVKTGDRLLLAVAGDGDLSRAREAMRMNPTGGQLRFPIVDLPAADTATSRFIAKVAVTALAHRGCDVDGWNAELVNKPELDLLRTHARRGQPVVSWPVHVRRIYRPDRLFRYPDGDFELLHEFSMLWTADGELYCVVAIFGVEYAINLGEPSLDGYARWLEANAQESPLHPGVRC